MYKCQLCGKTSQPHIPAYKITLETQFVSYPEREKANACHKRQRDGTTKFVRPKDKGGIGYQTLREVTACPACAAKSQNGNYSLPRLE